MYSRIIFSLVYATKSVQFFKERGTNLDDIQSVKTIESSTEKTSTSLHRYIVPFFRNGLGLSYFGGHFWAISRPNQLVQGPTSSKESNGNPFSVLALLSDQGDGKKLQTPTIAYLGNRYTWLKGSRDRIIGQYVLPYFL